MNQFMNSLMTQGNVFMLNASMEQVMDLLPFLIPVFILELALAIAALVHVIKHDHYSFGNKVVWIFVVLLIQIIGPIVYFAFGKGDE